MNQDRIAHERKHGDFLQANAEHIWGWGSPAGRARAQRRASLMMAAGEITSASRTLEVGCGTGLFTELVSKTGASIVACELCEGLVAQARCRTYHSDVTFLVHDAMDLLADHEGCFDVIWGSSVLHHLDLPRFLPGCYRLLKTGGRIVFAEPNMMNPQIWLQKNVGWLRRWAGESPDETAFYRGPLAAQLCHYGFEAVHIVPHEFLHPATPPVMIPLVKRMTDILERVPGIREIAGSLLISGRKGSRGKDHNGLK